jgi:uronate dehydrogenase
MQRVLVTGAAGRIGRVVVQALKARGHFVRGLDLRPSCHADESVVADIADGSSIQAAFERVDVAIHLAAVPDDEDFLTRLLPANVVGAYHVVEACRTAGVPRLVLASTGQVVWWQRFTGPLPVRADAPPSPRGWYAATKLFQEAAGRALAEQHGRTVIAARLGWVPRDRAHAEELAHTDWGPDVYLSPRDTGVFFTYATEAPIGRGFHVVYACSLPVRETVYDPRPAHDLLGYEPQDRWPQGVEDDMDPS